MRATFVVHTSEPVGDGAEVLLRPVVNEEQVNREWSPGATPSGELRLRVTRQEVARQFRPGARLDVTFDFPKPPKS